MKLRKLARLCEHHFLEPHRFVNGTRNLHGTEVAAFGECPGGVFLPDDTLVIEPRICGECDGRGTICAPHEDIPHDGGCRCPTCHGSGREYVVRPYPWPQWANPIVALLDALFVRESS